MDEHMLTTVDNPYDPFTEFEEWYTWDRRAGYDTPSYLARVVRSSDELSEADQSVAQEQAIDDIVNENVGFYIKVLSGQLKPAQTEQT
jgi:hypothetical protein